jgi:eukaryotic-like serine/threonine-protein kinase
VRGTVPPLSQFSSTVPHDLEAIVMEALSKSPSNRYQSADELRADLIRFSEGQPVHAAMRDTAFFGEDATRAVAAVAGERTRSVPVMTGPRTDVRRRRGISYSGISLVVVVLLIAAGVIFFLEHNKSTTTTVPNLVGQQLKAAKTTLKNDDILVGQVKERQSKKPSGSIISTNPAAGTVVAKGGSISIVESEGITTVTETVQDVVNQSVTNAETTLENEKLGVKIDQVPTAPPNTNPIPNTVLAQSPVAGTKVQSGTTVILTVLKSGVQYDLESVNGETQYAAGAALATQGLTVSGVTRTCSNTVNPGLVIGTDPVAGSLVKEGEAIQLQVSSGPCNVVMPGVVNDTESQADAALQQQGLTPSYSPDPTAVCEPGAEPTVASQANAPGSNVRYGSTVDLTICQTTANTTSTTTTTTTTP